MKKLQKHFFFLKRAPKKKVVGTMKYNQGPFDKCD